LCVIRHHPFFNPTGKFLSDFRILPSDSRYWEFSTASPNSDGDIRNYDRNFSTRLKKGRCLFRFGTSVASVQHVPKVSRTYLLLQGTGFLILAFDVLLKIYTLLLCSGEMILEVLLLPFTPKRAAHPLSSAALPMTTPGVSPRQILTVVQPLIPGCCWFNLW